MLEISEINKWVRTVKKYTTGGVRGEVHSDRLSFTCKNDEVEFELEIHEDNQRLIMRAINAPFDFRNPFDDFSVIEISDCAQLQQVLSNYSQISYWSKNV